MIIVWVTFEHFLRVEQILRWLDHYLSLEPILHIPKLVQIPVTHCILTSVKTLQPDIKDLKSHLISLISPSLIIKYN